MTLEITKTDAYGNTDIQTISVSAPSHTESVAAKIESTTDSATESAQELWVAIQPKTTAFLDDAYSSIENFYITNQQLLTRLGLVLLGIIGLKVLFAGLSAIDGIPLVTPLLKIVGLYYVGRFIWRYSIRAQDRQELMAYINQTKAEVLGARN